MTIDTVEKVLEHIRDNPQGYPEFENARDEISDVADIGFIVCIDNLDLRDTFIDTLEVWQEDNPDRIIPDWDDFPKELKKALRREINKSLEGDCFDAYYENIQMGCERFMNDYSTRR